MKVGFISLGCAKNQVNCEQMIWKTYEAGYEVALGAEDCDVAVVNTCGFLQEAREEALAEIDALAKTSYAVTFGSGVVSGGSSLRSAIVDYAYSFLGTPYVYGGASRSGTDCSGLTMQLFGYYGISLGHGCVSQYYASQPISRSELQPGDLVFFYEGIGHVGIYIGGGQFIHASDYGVVVASLYTNYWSACYYGAGRILAD